MNSKIKKGLGRGLSSLIGETKVETKINKLLLQAGFYCSFSGRESGTGLFGSMLP